MAKTVSGIVVSAGNDKTITVQVNHARQHPLYRKNYTVSKKFHVHDEKNQAVVGDKVEISESTPISKTKHYILATVVEKAGEVQEDI